MSSDLLALIIGAGLGLTALFVLRSLPSGVRLAAIMALVGAIAAVPFGAAMMMSDMIAMAVEGAVGLVLILGALVVWMRAPRWLGAVILVHGLVDLLHILGGHPAPPRWYSVSCVGFDLVFGLGALMLFNAFSAPPPKPRGRV